MFITKIELNPKSRQVQAELKNLYEMHRTLSKAFGDDPAEYDAARCLFRVDDGGEAGLYVLVQSRVRPDWTRLTVPAAYMAGPPQTKEFLPEFRAGQRLHYRVRANPTVKRDGKRLGLYKEEEQLAWLHRKGEMCGFAPLSAACRADDKLGSRTVSGCDATFVAATFDGILTVTDPVKFRDALESGIGSAKGFGFGLLSVAPVK
jgi:CRISPR system Cascade subunit CasE